MRMGHLFCVAMMLLSAVAQAAESTAPQSPGGLLINLLRHPELTVITDPSPRFSWIVNDPRNRALQSAYQIQLFRDPDNSPAWDSGKTMSNQSVAVPCTGPALASNTLYSWQVRTWDANDHPSPWSIRQHFSTGDLARQKTWPGESRWVEAMTAVGEKRIVPEDRQAPELAELAPAIVTLREDHTTFVDFARDAYGTLKLKLDSPDDRTITIRLGEKLDATGRIDRKPPGNVYFGEHKLAISKGSNLYTLTLPRHITHSPHPMTLPGAFPEVEPFRYVEIDNSPSLLTAADVRQVAMLYPFDPAESSFNCNDANLNAIWNLCHYTMKAAPFCGVYIDGVRERMPYEADCYIEQLGHYCCDREFAIQRYSASYLFHHATWPTEWNLLCPLIAHADYIATGDTALLSRDYDLLKAKLLLPLAREDGLISTKTGKQTLSLFKNIDFDGKQLRDLVDWPQPGETDGYVFTQYNTVVNAIHYAALVNMSDIAGALGKNDDAHDFAKRAASVKDSFNKVFFDPSRGLYVDGEGATHASLHANAIPLAVGLVPLEHVATVANFIKSRKMNCGPYGAQFVIDSLVTAGDANAAIALMTNDTDRGWLHMLHLGATITMEAWDAKYKGNLTWNHAWGAAPANLIPRKLMGVEPLAPGFAKIRIHPQLGPLADAELKLPTVRGTVSVRVYRDKNDVSMDVTIPANMSAEVFVPGADSMREISSGTYHFTERQAR
jgi:alpha-L-rhamnosidase